MGFARLSSYVIKVKAKTEKQKALTAWLNACSIFFLSDLSGMCQSLTKKPDRIFMVE